MLRSSPWPTSGAPGAVARAGSVSAPTLNIIRMDIMRVCMVPNCCAPWRRPPSTKASPSTSRLFARIEPIERRLHDHDQPGLQGEDRNEQFGQVAQRRLQDPGGARPHAGGRVGRSRRPPRRPARPAPPPTRRTQSRCSPHRVTRPAIAASAAPPRGVRSSGPRPQRPRRAAPGVGCLPVAPVSVMVVTRDQ